MGWKPLLTGDLADKAIDSVREIATELEKTTPDITLASYAGGHCGLALFFGYLAKTLAEQRWRDAAFHHLELAQESLDSYPLPLGFFLGLTGVAWSFRHLAQLLESPLPEGFSSVVDEALESALFKESWPWEHDLVHGLAGLGCYVLDHPDRASASQMTDQILRHLSAQAETQQVGIAWRSKPELMPPRSALRYPRGRLDLGVAHGLAGVIGILAEIRADRQGEALPADLLETSVDCLRSCRRADDGGSTFPTDIVINGSSSRSAWCYGDPGMGVVLFSAAKSMQQPTWEREALSILVRDARRPYEDTGVVDSGLCHGSAGLGHIYNRLFQHTGEELMAQAAERWFHRTLSNRRPGEGIAGYLTLWPELQEWRPKSDLLGGAAGIGLALLAAATDCEPVWDRPFLLSSTVSSVSPERADSSGKA